MGTCGNGCAVGGGEIWAGGVRSGTAFGIRAGEMRVPMDAFPASSRDDIRLVGSEGEQYASPIRPSCGSGMYFGS